MHTDFRIRDNGSDLSLFRLPAVLSYKVFLEHVLFVLCYNLICLIIVLLNLYDRRIVSYKISCHNDNALVMSTIDYYNNRRLQHSASCIFFSTIFTKTFCLSTQNVSFNYLLQFLSAHLFSESIFSLQSFVNFKSYQFFVSNVQAAVYILRKMYKAEYTELLRFLCSSYERIPFTRRISPIFCLLLGIILLCTQRILQSESMKRIPFFKNNDIINGTSVEVTSSGISIVYFFVLSS